MTPKARKRARKQLKAIRKHLLARGADPAECEVMLAAGTDADMLRLWLGQLRAPEPPATPLGMDSDRYQLHQEAKALAAEKRRTDPTVSQADAYMMATLEIEDRKFLGPI